MSAVRLGRQGVKPPARVVRVSGTHLLGSDLNNQNHTFMKNTLKIQIMGIIYPPEGVIYPTMPSKEDLLMELFGEWALAMVGDDVPKSDAVFMWEGQDWSTPKVEGWNGAKNEIRRRIKQSLNTEEEV